LREIEVIVIDDGSTDGSSEIAVEFCENDERFVYVWQHNVGVGKALNQGLVRANGVFITRVDADDWVELEMYEHLYRTAVTHGAFHIRSGYFRERVNGVSQKMRGCSSLEQNNGQVYFKKLFGETFTPLMSTCFGIYHRQTLLDAGITYSEELTNLEDIFFNARFYALDLPIVFLPDCLYHYREVSNSLSQNPTVMLPEQFTIFEDLMHKEFVLNENPRYAEPYVHYRAIAILTTAADMSIHGSAGMQALRNSTMYKALCDEPDKSGYPKSLRVLMTLMKSNNYPAVVAYAHLLRLARDVKRKLRQLRT